MHADPTLNIAQSLTRAYSLVGTLEKIGAPVSAEITTAVEFAKTTTHDVSQQVTTARDALIAAQTPEQVGKALEQYSAAINSHQVREAVANILEAEKWRRLSGALLADGEAIFNHLAVGFDSLAGKFQKAADNLPANITDKYASAFSYTEDESAAILKTGALAKQMNVIFGAYTRFCELGGYLDDDRLIPYALGELVSNPQALSAHDALSAAKVSDSGKKVSPIMPYIVIHQLGVKLRLHPRPWELREERQVLIDQFGTSIGHIGTTVVGSF